MIFYYNEPDALNASEELSRTLVRLYYDNGDFSAQKRRDLVANARNDLRLTAKAMGCVAVRTEPSDILVRDVLDYLQILVDQRQRPDLHTPDDIYNTADMLCKAAEKLLRSEEQNLSEG